MIQSWLFADDSSMEEEEGGPAGNKSAVLMFHRGVMDSADGHSSLTPTSTPSLHAWNVSRTVSLRKCCVHSAGFISAEQNRGSEGLGYFQKPGVTVCQ